MNDTNEVLRLHAELEKADRYILNRCDDKRSRMPDHACAECQKDGLFHNPEIIIDGFQCAFHSARQRLEERDANN